MAANARLRNPATESDLLALPDDGRGWELMAGELVEKDAGARHSRAQAQMAGQIVTFDRRAGGGGDEPGGWWILTEQLVRMEPHTLRPDLAGWRRARLPALPNDDTAVIAVRPDWVCEILSPRKAVHDLVRKKRIYFQQQVPHYWLVDPRDESLTVLRWTPAGYLEVVNALRDERVRAEPFEQVELVVGLLFGDDELGVAGTEGGG